MRVAAALLVGAAAVAASIVATIAGAAPPAKSTTDATAAAVRVIVAGQPTVSGAEVVGPPGASTEVTGFSYPDDGSILRVGSASGTATTQPGAAASAEALTSTVAVTLFGGEITIASVATHATAAAGAATASADTSSSQIQGLQVLGQAAPVTATTTPIALADWGTLELLVASSSTRTEGKTPKTAQASVIGVRIKVLLEHDGLAAGSEIDLGTAQAAAVQAAESPAATVTTPTKAKPSAPVVDHSGRRKVVEPGSSIPGAPPALVHSVPPDVKATLSSQGFVFPVYGPATFGDSFGAPRPDIASGWHHGEDIFAPKGTPLLAVTDGTVHTVGWNEIGGWRLWIRDGQGDEFYYAHLSAYSPLAVEGKHVRAGDVVGFLGDSGDADGGLPHLHFEIHPAALAALGYDGVIAPYPFLVAWKRAQDVSFSQGRV